VARLAEGADFAELARGSSPDGVAVSGDDLGWLARGELQPLFEEPILRLQKGEVTPPIKSENGYHLFRLEEREELTPELLGQLRQQARDILSEEIRSAWKSGSGAAPALIADGCDQGVKTPSDLPVLQAPTLGSRGPQAAPTLTRPADVYMARLSGDAA
jgi:hypothetical protein